MFQVLAMAEMGSRYSGSTPGQASTPATGSVPVLTETLTEQGAVCQSEDAGC